MPDQDIFSDNNQNKNQQPNPAGTPPQSQTDPFVDLLAEIKNENGENKYKSVEDALKALKASQQFIETLKEEKKGTESELEAARTELAKMSNIEDFVNRISPNAEPKKPEPTGNENKGLSEEEITKLLESALARRETQFQQDNNLSSVISIISQEHGDKASDFIATRAKELNTTPAQLRDLAKSNPTMALTLLNVKSKAPIQPSQSTINSNTNIPNNNEPPKFTKGASRGGMSQKELLEMWRGVKDYTYKQLNVEN